MNKKDITSKVYGKINPGSMSLYLNEHEIGKIRFTNQGYQYEMSQGFEFNNDKIYQHESNEKKQDKFVDNCDIGWC